MRVGVDMVAHITLQHGNIFKISFFLSCYVLLINVVIFSCLINFFDSLHVNLLAQSTFYLQDN